MNSASSPSRSPSVSPCASPKRRLVPLNPFATRAENRQTETAASTTTKKSRPNIARQTEVPTEPVPKCARLSHASTTASRAAAFARDCTQQLVLHSERITAAIGQQQFEVITSLCDGCVRISEQTVRLALSESLTHDAELAAMRQAMEDDLFEREVRRMRHAERMRVLSSASAAVSTHGGGGTSRTETHETEAAARCDTAVTRVEAAIIALCPEASIARGNTWNPDGQTNRKRRGSSGRGGDKGTSTRAGRSGSRRRGGERNGGGSRSMHPRGAVVDADAVLRLAPDTNDIDTQFS
jgi:hypothetical protein